jgi:hypothetical protein
MFSGPLEKTVISIGSGVVVGLADAVGFYYTARMFLVNATSRKRTIAAVFEALRLVILIAAVLLMYGQLHLSMVWLLAGALFVSLGGKFFFIFKRMKQ